MNGKRDVEIRVKGIPVVLLVLFSLGGSSDANAGKVRAMAQLGVEYARECVLVLTGGVMGGSLANVQEPGVIGTTVLGAGAAASALFSGETRKRRVINTTTLAALSALVLSGANQGIPVVEWLDDHTLFGIGTGMGIGNFIRKHVPGREEPLTDETDGDLPGMALDGNLPYNPDDKRSNHD